MQFPAGNENSTGIRGRDKNEATIVMNTEHC